MPRSAAMWCILLTPLFFACAFGIPPLQINGIDCTCDGDICTESFCYLAHKRPYLNLANFGLFVGKRQSQAFVRTQFYNYNGDDYVPVGPNFYEDICDVTLARSRSFAFVVLLTDMSKYAVNLACPFENNVSVLNFPPVSMLFPSFIKTKQYKLMFSIGAKDTNLSFFSVSLHLYTTWV